MHEQSVQTALGFVMLVYVKALERLLYVERNVWQRLGNDRLSSLGSCQRRNGIENPRAYLAHCVPSVLTLQIRSVGIELVGQRCQGPAAGSVGSDLLHQVGGQLLGDHRGRNSEHVSRGVA